MFTPVINLILDIFIKLILFLLFCIFPFIGMSTVYFIYYKFVKKIKTPKKRFFSNVKRQGFLKRLFIDFPKQFVYDVLMRDPDEFGYYGFHLFVGEQGSGKTVATVEMLRRIKQQYPSCKIATNFEYKAEDSKIESWRDLIFHNNGIYGQADVIDEVQNWFSCNQSKDFPPEMIQEITQQRKQRKILIGTTQRFERMAKPLREQVNLIYQPFTIAGCLTIVRVCKPTVDSSGEIKKMNTRRIYFFVHDEELRNSFDTYHKIAEQAKSGFNSDNRDNELLINTTIIDNNVKARRKK